MSVRSRMSIRAYDNLHIPSKPGKAIEHFYFADPTKLSAQHFGQFWLSDAKDFGRLLLAPFPASDDFADLGREPCLDQHFVGADHA